MAQTKLDYLKQQFLKNADFTYIQNNKESVGEKEIFSFVSFLEETKDHVLEAQSEEKMMQHLKELREVFLVSNRSLRKMEHPITDKLYQYYFKSNINNIDNWYDLESANYSDKASHGFFSKFDFGNNKDYRKETLLLNEEMIEKAHSIINKYNLTGIDLTDAKSSQEAITYLNKIDKSFTDVCKNLAIKPEAIGLNRTIGLTYTSQRKAEYNAATKDITTTIASTVSSTMLHEWIHAFDNHVAYQVTGFQHEFVSNQEKTVAINDTPINQAYHSLRKLTSRLFNANEKEVIDKMQEQMYLGSCKFLSLVIGDEWYGYGAKERQALLTPETMKAINNYMSEYIRYDKYVDIENSHLSTLIQTLTKTQLITESELRKNLEKQYNNLEQDVVPYFEKMNKNILGKTSFYYNTSNFSSWQTSTSRFIVNTINRIKSLTHQTIHENKGNTLEKDYFIQPVEMLARYFESQIYPIQNNLTYLMTFAAPYKLSLDKDFTEIKDKLISLALGADMLIEKNENQEKLDENTHRLKSTILALRQKQNPQKQIELAPKIFAKK